MTKMEKSAREQRYYTSTHCEICKEEVNRRGKTAHYKARHPEIAFEHGMRGKRFYLQCALCYAHQSSFPALVEHFKSECKIPRHSLLPVSTLVPMSSEIALDGFFENIGMLTKEIKELRRQRDEWKKKSESWAARIIELQNLMGRPS